MVIIRCIVILEGKGILRQEDRVMNFSALSNLIWLMSELYEGLLGNIIMERNRNRQVLDKTVKGLLLNGSQILASSGETLKTINA